MSALQVPFRVNLPSQYTQMTEAARYTKELIARAFNEVMQVKLRQAMKTIDERMRQARARKRDEDIASGNYDDDDDEIDSLLKQEDKERTISPADIFAAVNVNGEDDLVRSVR